MNMKRTCNGCKAQGVSGSGASICVLGYTITRDRLHDTFSMYPCEPCPKPRTNAALLAAPRKENKQA